MLFVLFLRIGYFRKYLRIAVHFAMVTIEKVNSVQDSVKNHGGQEQVTKDNGEVIHEAVSDTNARMSLKLSL
ncbi:MAG: hypothetical protein Q8918_03860 [Bacteroidota bacterium]|nr:hypothetical protein [Bacteroidota bacterium]MDP4249229.1 hypothetical protein [Bacteroidota bacterium]